MKRALTICCLGLVSLIAFGQTPASNKLIAVNVVSTDAGLQAIQPELGRTAADVIEHFKEVHSLIVPGESSDAGDRARQKGAQFLILIEVSPRSNVGLEFGAKDYPNSTEPERAQARGAIFLKYSVASLDGKFHWSDSTYLRPETYPLGPKWDWLHSIASQSVRDAANISMKQLKKKKLI